MKAPTPEQIEAEIKALEAAKGWAPKRTMFGDDNHRNIDLQIQYLRGEIDMTAEEWDEYSESEQSAIFDAQNWQDGDSDESPSSGWDNFKTQAEVKPPKKKTKVKK